MGGGGAGIDLVGVAGLTSLGADVDVSGTGEASAAGLPGDAGRLAVGVESAVAVVATAFGFGGRGSFSFFAFFLRLMIASWAGSSSAASPALAFSSSSKAFARSWRSFFSCDFVFVLTGAEPTLLVAGGGELARDTEVEVSDTLSDIETCSLEGVPGMSIDPTLG